MDHDHRKAILLAAWSQALENSSPKKLKEQCAKDTMKHESVEARKGVGCRNGPGCESMVTDCHLHETRAYCTVAMGI